MRLLPVSGLILLFAALSHAQSAADMPPSLIYRSEPEYSAEATRARVQSSVMLGITVGEDGRAHDIHVTEGAGFGLDEMAIEAMDKWRFNPGTHDGHPAAAPANIEMNFSILAKNDKEDRSGQLARLNFTLPPDASRPELLVGMLPADPKGSGDQSLRFHLQVDAQGVPKNVTVISSDAPVWEKQVQRVVQTWRFQPAVVNGNPVAVEGVFEIAHSGPPPDEAPAVNVVVPEGLEASNKSNDDAPAPRLAQTSLPVAGLIARAAHTATLLANGTVLLAGGESPESLRAHVIASAQTYDSVTRSIANTGNLLTPREGHSATLLKDGTVLIVGGETAGHKLASTEIFDPSTGKFSEGASLQTAREAHAAALLPDGRVLICGGIGVDGKVLASAEIYDPRLKSFLSAGAMAKERISFNAVTLKDGRVLLVGAGASAEVFDPESGAFSPVGSMASARFGSSATLFDNGQVLIAGGTGGSQKDELASAEIFDPVTNSFRATGSMAWARAVAVAVRLVSGKVLISGGSAQTEIYDPNSGTFSLGPLLSGAHRGDTATLLENGTVLLAGSSAEVLQVR